VRTKVREKKERTKYNMGRIERSEYNGENERKNKI
jgi:hypothetical protein